MDISQEDLSHVLQPYITRFQKHLPELDKETGGMEKRQSLIAQVRGAFSEKAIHDLTEERFRKIFLEFYSIYGISRPSKEENRNDFLTLLIKEGFQSFKQKLISLLYGSDPFESRYSTLIRTTPNLGRAITSELLCYTAPERFAILNGPTERALWITGLNKYITASKGGGDSGEYYLQFTELAQKILEVLRKYPEFRNSNLALVDYFLFAISKTHFWQIAPGEKGKYWVEDPVWQKRGIVSVDYHEMVASLHEDLLRIDSYDELLEEYKKSNPEASIKSCQLQTRMLHNFLNEVEMGDLVVANRGKATILGYGRIVSEPEIDESLEYPTFREVEWIRTDLNAPIAEELKGKFGRTINDLSIKEYRTLIQKNDSGRLLRYWNVHPTSRDGKGIPMEFWDEWQKRGIVTVGWQELARKYGDAILECNDRDSFLAAYKKVNNDRTGPNLWYFLREMNEGDIILVNRGRQSIAGRGIITSPARIDHDADYPFHRMVDWEVFPAEISIPPNLKGKFSPIVRELSESEYREIMTSITTPQHPLFEPIQYVLEYKKQVILYGPPGTGKTWMAKNYIKNFGKPALQEETAGSVNASQLVTFHQSFSYEEFVEGLRPSSDGEGNICYSVHEGIFKTLCRNAFNALMKEAGLSKVWPEEGAMPLLTAEERQRVAEIQDNVPFFLVIDEINRGDISRIFGELITLLESDKRLFAEHELAVTLPYSKTSFGVPPNLLIIGTMNTADKSISLVDVALRRRFGFIEMMPRIEVLEEHLQSEDESIQEIFDLAIGVLKTVNQQITALYDRDHQIGHSYLMKLKDAVSREDATERLLFVWYYEILPLLQEYFYDSPRKMKEILGDAVDIENHSFTLKGPWHGDAFISYCRVLAGREHSREIGEEFD